MSETATKKAGPQEHVRWMRRTAVGLLFAALAVVFSDLPAGSQGRDLPPAPGRLLVATEGMFDPRFNETVILLVNYDRTGAMGLILNRPTRLSLGEGLPVLPELAEGVHADDPIYYGGPVALDTPLALLKTVSPPENSRSIFKDIVLTGAPDVAARLAAKPHAGDPFRIFAGYSGWRAGQLEGEIGRGDWEVRPFEADAVFTSDPDKLWERIRTKEERIWI